MRWVGSSRSVPRVLCSPNGPFVARIPISRVHGFSVVTRVSRNGSALTSQLLRHANAIDSHRVGRRFLSDVSLRQRQNVAVGLRTTHVGCGTRSNGSCVLGLVSAPNRISFSCRISQSLVTYRKTLLIISTSRNMRTRALTGICLTLRGGLRVVPILGGVSLPKTSPRQVGTRVRSVVNLSYDNTVLTSTGRKINVSRVLRSVICLIPPPPSAMSRPLHTLVFSDCCSPCHNIVICFQIVSNDVHRGSGIQLVTSNGRCRVSRLNILTPARVGMSRLRTKRMNCFTTSVGTIRSTHINSAVALIRGPTARTLPNCTRTGPVIFYNLFPATSSRFRRLQRTLRGLHLDSTTLRCRPRASDTVKFNFHYNFLNLLRVRVIRRHLRQRCGLSLVAATPSMVCHIAAVRNRILRVSGPDALPSPRTHRGVRRPCIRLSVVAPRRCIKALVRLYRKQQNRFGSVGCLTRNHAALVCRIPLTRMIASFFSRVGSHAGNCTDVRCRLVNCHRGRLIQLSVLVGNSRMSSLTSVIRHSGTCCINGTLIRGLGRLVPHRRFGVPVRTTVNDQIITDRDVPTLHGSILTGYCKNSVSQGGGLLRGRTGNGGHLGTVNAISIPRRTFVTILGLSWDDPDLRVYVFKEIHESASK